MKPRVFDLAGAGIGVAVFGTVAGTLLAENVSVDPATVMGGGGLTMGGFLLHAIWKYLNRHEKLQEIQEKVATAQLASILEERDHRAAERSHWNMVEHRLDSHTRMLERMDSGRYTPVEGIPLIREPGVPR
jgi:hypothetical protein